MPSSWFTDSDVADAIALQWPELSNVGDLVEGSAQDAINEFEDESGRQPFLAGASSDRSFDPPSGFARAIAFVSGVTTVSSVTVDGSAWVDGTDYVLKPYNNPSQDKPYEFMQLLRGAGSKPKSVVIHGTWGYGAEVPEDAYRPTLRRAMSLALPAIINGITQGTVSWSDGDADQKFDSASMVAMGKLWDERFNRTAERFSNNLVGI